MTLLWAVLSLACLAVQVAAQPCDPATEFECASGGCIAKARRCNRIFECLDFSDEDYCPIAKCKPGEFQCATGDCVHGVLRCNGSPDCPDKSDESGCVKILCHGHSFIYNSVTRTCLSCQHNTQGRNCDTCKPGFYGNAKIGSKNDCKQCSCNGHSTTCDITGKCTNCGHNTEGEKCEKCRPGFRGDATKGTPTDCKSSSTGPTKTCNTCNGHSTTCDATGKCVNCQDNTEGAQCEKCAKGWWGVATSGGKCLKCICNNHADDCEKAGGKCLNCKDNTQGFFCNQCATGFVGTATDGKKDSCKAANCDVLCYKHSTTCNVNTGKCTNCKDNTEGDRCDKCKTGFTGNPTTGVCTAGAKPTNCATLCYGHSTTCNVPAGTCSNCQHNTEGPRCQTCKPGYTGDATKGPTGCKSCLDNCNKHSSTCDKSTGVCTNCQHQTTGSKCEKCIAGYTGDPTKGTSTDCKPTAGCPCNKHSSTCPGGVCKNCQHHTTGKYCETCDTGYYGKATGGTPNDCKKCPCSPRSTMCILLPGQSAPTCMGCKDGYAGSNCNQCDTLNGFVPLGGGPTAAGGCCVKKGVTNCPVTVAAG
ncbi:PREDICTED: basement membrane-specific heparan sulfate proteoglycan core protein-like isoform X3 [Branchiostoma belcheri]|uniref:Basement membrane-specific heparan sulfate proteoglycan core protein-like isoform X3 n=1 Tax=Branchiostoma belcheri TaxID=7741 RepID=A0A6P4Z7D3_BRABE|nr:PREDICTED: basement membrane-specific heparan sulfate proteoglycan core protein-like isoform X3 [Branchiostoma belcheri]